MDRETFIDTIKAANESGGCDRVREALATCLKLWDGPPNWIGPLRGGDFSVIHRESTLTIMNIIWPPGIITEPHNHNAWAVIGIYQGREDNLLWQRDGTGLKPVGGVSLAAGDTHAMSRDDIHTAFNPSQSLSGAIHIYQGDFLTTPKREWDPVTHEERPRIMTEAFAHFKE
jgi:predicted metal-dependent enzyme (double-stranded beta helix superfamily)